MIKKAKKYSNRISVMFSLLTILTLTLTLLVSAALVYLLAKTGILTNRNRTVVLLLIAAVSVIIGTLLSKLAGRKPIAAIVSISDATKEIAKGNFEVCLSEKVPAKELQDMAHNFNLMAKELAGTELLRNDFVENVSHEFKTPLSAIEGYVMLLQKPGLSDEKRAR